MTAIREPLGCRVPPEPPPVPVRAGRAVGERLRALTTMAQALGGVHRLDDLVRVAAAGARTALGASSVSISPQEPDAARDHRRDAAANGRCLTVPILLDGHRWGDLSADRRADQPPFDAADVEFAAVVAAQIAAGVAQARHHERVERLAYADSLTGLANRRAVDARLDRAIERHRAEGTVVSLLICDLNGLKRLNDERGHDVGDRLLTDFADLLAGAAERLSGSLAARLGGDEFCLLVEGHRADRVVQVAEDLCLAALRLAGGEGVSCGVASTEGAAGSVPSAERLFRLADAAQYRAKRGRSIRPVVAGREAPPAFAGAAAAEDAPSADRRRFRGLVARDPAHLLTAGLSSLDAVGRAGAVDRLGAVADTAARLVDGVGWWVSGAAPGSLVLRTQRFSVYRTTGLRSARRDAHQARGAEFHVGRYPLSAAALDGGGFVLEAGEPGNDPAAEAILAAGGYRAVLAAGDRHGGAGWLVEVFTDEISGPVRGLVQPLRALVAVALTGAI